MSDMPPAGALSTDPPPAATTEITIPPPSRWDAEIWDKEAPGKFVPKWQEKLPQEMEDYKAMLANYQDMPALVKSLKDFMTQARTKGGVRPLAADSPPEAIAEFRKAFGIPDEPYKFDKPEQLPEGIEWKEDRAKAFGEWAHKNHLTPQQAKEALNLHMQFLGDDVKSYSQAQQAAYEQQLAAEKEQLRTHFGGGLDNAVTQAKRVALKYDLPPDVMDPNHKSFVGVTMLKVFSDVAKALGEGRDGALPTAAATMNMDPYRMATAMKTDKNHPDYAALARGDRAAQDKYYGLLRMAKEQGALPK